MEEDYIIQITSKGEASGAEIFLSVYTICVNFLKENPNASLKEFIEKIHKVLLRQIRRARENKDGTMSLSELENIHEISRIVDKLSKTI